MQLQQSRRPLAWTTLLCALLGAGAATAQPAGDATSVAKGKRLFMRCAACHDVGDTPSGRIGPNLKGLLGRPLGGLVGYNYSPAMKAQKQVWDEALLNAWLTKPTNVVPGTTMAFIGIPDADERKALIDYLRSAK
ncbi:c-type cytochrome [Roseateles cellulosilyticus]|uniref:C-type cytochrome n=1 Tax=Pelomonas cellulosilytica TaxID=2906762 RepID=A0ABS8XMB8_9BURK|nr:c-type cytochrome [Pelomonas sp. P8]MCE4552875.1 c-type cytochrome [Pelomonas sp. P8]